MNATQTRPAARAPQPAAPSARRMTLSSIRKTLDRGPEKLFLYGIEGVGKSSFAAAAPNPVFLAAEDGIRNLVPVPESFPTPETFQDVLDAVAELETGQHSYQTLVVDTIDAVDALIRDQVCRRNGWSPEDFDAYGRGLKVTPDEHRRLIAALDRLAAIRGMNVIVLAHARTKTFKNPAGADYLRYEPNLAGEMSPALWKYWAEAVLFATHEAFVQVAKSGSEDPALKRGKGVSTGRRVLYTEWNAAYDAKNRYGLPSELPLDFAEYAAARERGHPASPDALRTEVLSLVEELRPTPETRAAIGVKLAACGESARDLARLVNLLREKVTNKGNDTGTATPAQEGA
ncbi:MAG: ATP-binding protein [Planctomycetes bacterium]|nr:ATP-binding protein [Planctomycetota bacterium]